MDFDNLYRALSNTEIQFRYVANAEKTPERVAAMLRDMADTMRRWSFDLSDLEETLVKERATGATRAREPATE